MTMEVKEILVPIDFSDVSQAALDFAVVVAERFNAEMHVLHVDDDPILNAPTTSDEFREESVAKSKQQLDELFDEQTKPGLRLVLAVRCNTRTTQAILDYIENFNIDLIVMGAKGRSALANMLLGSVAEDLMKKAPCPVVTIRKPD